jgi:hypothetical protein
MVIDVAIGDEENGISNLFAKKFCEELKLVSPSTLSSVRSASYILKRNQGDFENPIRPKGIGFATILRIRSNHVILATYHRGQRFTYDSGFVDLLCQKQTLSLAKDAAELGSNSCW